MPLISTDPIYGSEKFEQTNITRTLKRQGTNLNQLATLANMGRIQSVNVSDTYDLLLDIHKLLKKILERKV